MTRVLIVGAGPTGLNLALRLARQGVPFRLVDRKDGPGPASRAMVVHARTLELYRQLGLADELVALGTRMETLRFREHGAEVAHLELRDIGTGMSPFPFALCLPQDEHERFLVRKLEDLGAAVEWGTELRSFTQNEAGVLATLDHGGRHERCAAAYLCGCDGAHSRVREGLGIGFPGGTYEQLFYVADVRIAGPFRTEMTASLDADGLALLFPVRRNGMQRLIGLAPKGAADAAGMTFDRVRPRAENLLGLEVEEVDWFSAYHVHRRVADRFRAGRGFILGDAAHIHSPAGGQGMNTGIGDAVNLAWKLADVLGGRAGPAILDSFEEERIPFARRLVATTDRAFTGMVDRGWAGRTLRRGLVPHLLPLVTGVPAARRLIFKTLSQIHIKYRGSALSQGRAGTTHGGDRLPWVATQGGDNLASLTGEAWRLHVYGRPEPGLAAAAAALGLQVDSFPWDGHAGLGRDAAYLLRPDGHVALALPDQDARSLQGFVARHGLGWEPERAAPRPHIRRTAHPAG